MLDIDVLDRKIVSPYLPYELSSILILNYYIMSLVSVA